MATAGAAAGVFGRGDDLPLPVVGTEGRRRGSRRLFPPHLQVWLDARKRYRLCHVHVQMSREPGLNPKKFGKLGQNRQEPWKAPPPRFIEHIHAKRPGRERPEIVVPVEETRVAEDGADRRDNSQAEAARGDGGHRRPIGTRPPSL